MDCYVALDQGTTSSRAILFDGEGVVLSKAQHEITQYFPGPGLVEHDAEEIFATQWRAAEEAHLQAGRPAVRAVGITNQRETVVVFDRKSGTPIHRAIVWQDRRTAGVLAEMSAAGDRVRELTGLPLDPYFSAAKIAWVLDQVPGARKAAERGELGACTVDCWLLYKLTGGQVFATEPSNASRTSLFDLRAGDWNDELLELFRVPRTCLPEIRPSAGDFGAVEATGWPIRGMVGDQQAALFGQGCIAPGTAKCTYGTGAFMLYQCGREVPEPAHGLLGTVAWGLGDRLYYALEGSILVCGAAIQWLRDGLGILENASDSEAMARSVPDSGGVVLVPAFAGLGTPHWDPHARGLLVGITRGTSRDHVVRAALEAMALQVRDVHLAMEECTGRALSELRVDGGAAANDLLLEIQAALCGVPVVRPANLETTALGAFRMAMLGCGAVAGPADLPGVAGAQSRVLPEQGPQDTARLCQAWRVAVQRSRGWAQVWERPEGL
jgi:glycerol kinase